MIYTVKNADSVYSVAENFGISPERIIVDNGLISPYELTVGQSLLILIPSLIHTVQKGETLNSIARMYSVDVMDIYRKNYSLGGTPDIYPGKNLVINYRGENKGYSIYTTSYAYPFISDMKLREVMPYLSGMVPFTYGFTESGELVGLDDEDIIKITKEFASSPIMHLSTLTNEGIFNNTLSAKLFNDSGAMANLTENILKTMKEKGYSAIDVDFEFVPREDKEKYAGFLKMLRNAIAPEGYKLIVALAPKTSDEQKGLLYEGHDYALIGDAADLVLLMTYEWGYAYSEPMAVAPIENVKKVVEYAVTRIPSEKLLLGIPNYGYDWSLPFSENNPAVSISNREAIRLAEQYGARINFDPNSKTPFFNYKDSEGVFHEVWFEDPRSIETKLMLVKQYGLSGVGVWNAMREFPSMWLQLAVNFNIMQNIE